MTNIHMRIGSQLGEILLQTAQEKIKNGECLKAIELYTESLHGFTEEYVGKVLRNEMVLVTDEDGVNMNLVEKTISQIFTIGGVSLNLKLNILMSFEIIGMT